MQPPMDEDGSDVEAEDQADDPEDQVDDPEDGQNGRDDEEEAEVRSVRSLS